MDAQRHALELLVTAGIDTRFALPYLPAEMTPTVAVVAELTGQPEPSAVVRQLWEAGRRVKRQAAHHGGQRVQQHAQAA